MNKKKSPEELKQAALSRYHSRLITVNLLKQEIRKLQDQLTYLNKLQRRDRAKIKEYSR